jgi:hypothetical protein
VPLPEAVGPQALVDWHTGTVAVLLWFETG